MTDGQSKPHYEPPQIAHEEVFKASALLACSSSFDGMSTCRFDFGSCTFAEL